MYTNLEIVMNNAKILAELCEHRALLADSSDLNDPDHVKSLSLVSGDIKEALERIELYTSRILIERGAK